jgi:hypothetical protein
MDVYWSLCSWDSRRGTNPQGSGLVDFPILLIIKVNVVLSAAKDLRIPTLTREGPDFKNQFEFEMP